jgi:hypothetical protein
VVCGQRRQENYCYLVKPYFLEIGDPLKAFGTAKKVDYVINIEDDRRPQVSVVRVDRFKQIMHLIKL